MSQFYLAAIAVIVGVFILLWYFMPNTTMGAILGTTMVSRQQFYLDLLKFQEGQVASIEAETIKIRILLEKNGQRHLENASGIKPTEIDLFVGRCDCHS